MSLCKDTISQLFPAAIESEIEGLYVIPDWPKYLASPDGRIYSRYIDRFMSATYTKRGWLKLKFQYPNENRSKLMLVHRAIALAFMGPPTNPSESDIDHLDGDKENNAPTNLEYVSKRENTERAQRSGAFKKNFHIRVVDTYTGNTETYYSIESLRRLFDLGRRVMLRVVTQHSVDPWRNQYLFEVLDTGFHRDAVIVYSKDYVTGEIREHESTQRAAFQIGTSEMRVLKSIKTGCLTDGMVFSFTREFPEYSIEEVAFSRLGKRSDAKPSIRVIREDGTLDMYSSIDIASRELSLNSDLIRKHAIDKEPYKGMRFSFLAS